MAMVKGLRFRVWLLLESRLLGVKARGLALVEHLVIPSWPSDTRAWLAVQNQMIPIYLFLKNETISENFLIPLNFL